MGESALRLHMARNKQVNVKLNGTASTMKPFLQRKDWDNQKNICAATVNQEKDRTLSPHEDMPLNIPPPPATDAATSSGKSVSQFFSRNNALKSEILWTLKTISSHCSYNSNENIDQIFRVMFPDSQIAAKFTCRSRKTSYLCVFGLGYFTILFDESLNKKCEAKEMDIHIRFLEG